MALIRGGLWNVVKEMAIVPSSKTDAIFHTKYLLHKDRALAMIILSVEQSLLYFIGDPNDPAVV